MAEYSIYEGFMEDLRKKMTRIENKCKKYGCDFSFEETGEEYRDVVDYTTTNFFGEHPTYKLRFIKVEANGTAIINDWELVASVEHTEKGNIFSKAMIDVEIPERYRDSAPYCEHCNTNHYRKNTFIVRNTKTNEFKQVGRSCLCDFTFGMDANFAASVVSMRTIFEEYEEKDYSSTSFGFSEKYYDVREILCYASETIRCFGYVKSNEPGSTKETMTNFFNMINGDTSLMSKELYRRITKEIEIHNFNPNSEQAKTESENALKWLNDQKEINDYIHNLKVAVALENVTYKQFGLLVSLIPAYNKDVEKQIKVEQENEKVSDYVGTVGQRVQVSVNSVKCVTSWDNEYGTTYIWKIVDTNGNVFTWKTSNWLDENCVGKTLKGTVKEHKVFRDVKQTELTRCKVA